MEDVMLKVENVSKQYVLGQIGGTTLRDELQRLSARLHRREDPTKRVGERDYNKGETFLALDGVSFEVKKGERVGIIGHNGAGKSTLLKLISRVTAPTSGQIGMNGRVASMLEVGTGFHGELTGRENIYMNGAILGMKKREIDAKIEDIIDFSECRQFIDTPVKRYSSGMYVKLAFSVAAHLDSEIMIMDEVLAVGDMAFQKKCLEKMNDVSRAENRTILYVSHNMNTIRQLCERVIVLNHGKIVFDGGVEEGVGVYMDRGVNTDYANNWISFAPEWHEQCSGEYTIERIRLDNNKSLIKRGEDLAFSAIIINLKNAIRTINIRIIVRDETNEPVTMSYSKGHKTTQNKTLYSVLFKTGFLAPAKYSMDVVLYELGVNGASKNLDVVRNALTFIIEEVDEPPYGMRWSTLYWGHMIADELDIVDN